MASIVAASPSIKLKVTPVRGEFGGRGKRERGGGFFVLLVCNCVLFFISVFRT